MLEKIKALVAKLNKARYEYYVEDNPSMTDAEYDAVYAELEALEKETGIIEDDSPTHNVGFQIMSKLKKVKNNPPMLSLENINTIREVKDFVDKYDICVLSMKMDGLSCRLMYNEKGDLVRASTRGNGEEGEDITHNLLHFENVPLHIENDGVPFIFDGEVITTWSNFNSFNDTLPEDKRFSHPRNFAAGSVRQLDSKICTKRNLKFVVWRVINGFDDNSYYQQLYEAFQLGFDVVPHLILNKDYTEDGIKKIIEDVRATGDSLGYPYDGFVIAVNDLEKAKSLGVTAHHPQHSKALKEEQTPVKTILRDVEWRVGKTGLVAPRARFDKIVIDGSEIEYATLHNVSYIKSLKIGYKDEIEVIKAQKIIPKIIANNTQSDTIGIPLRCPCCDSNLVAKQEDKTYVGGVGNKTLMFDKGPVTLWCENPDCPEKNLSKFTQFVSKQGMNIDGLSEKKLEALVEKGYITDFLSIYNLKDFPQIADLEGFGKKSYQNLLDAIEKSRTVKLNNFIVALSIPNVGKTVAKTLYKCFKGNFGAFLDACNSNFDFSTLDDIGDTIASSIMNWYKNPNQLDKDFILKIVEGLREPDDIDKQVVFFDKSEFETNVLKREVHTVQLEVSGNYDPTFCQDKTFVVTGKFNKYKRDELETIIEDRDGKLASSVSKKTDFLLTNDSESGSSKAKKAKELNIPILSEDDFLEKVGLN